MSPPGLSAISRRAWLLFVLAAAAIAALIVHGPIAQAESYHMFADRRTIWSVPNLWNVASNLPFLAIGIYGLWTVFAGQGHRTLGVLRPAYVAFFVGVALVAFGSAYYHLRPCNETLVWDRLPITLAFTAFLVAILGERVDARCVRFALVPALFLGLLSVLWWQESGDLRSYVLVQLLPIIVIPAVVLLYPSRVSGAKWVWAVLVAYLVAKLFEAFDAPIYDGLGISGHTLKHVTAAIGVYFVVVMVRSSGSDAAPAESQASMNRQET